MRAVLLGLLAAFALPPSISLAQTLGACCPPPCFECYVVTEEECTELGGDWSGEGTTCDPPP